MAPGRLAVLLALTVGPAVGEAVVLRSLHFRSALPLAAQVTAPAPFGVFHDLRWLIVYHDSWWGLTGEVAAAIVLRGLLDAAIVGAAWPPGLPRPGFTRRLRTSASFTAIALLVLSPWAAVAFAASETALSWFVLGELVPIACLALVLQRGPITPRWWRGFPPARAVFWSLGTFVGLMVDALLIASAPGWWAVPAAGLAGVGNAWLWRRLVVAVAAAAPTRVGVPGAPAVILLTAAGLIAMGRFSQLGSEAISTPSLAPLAEGLGSGQVPLYVAGYDTSYSGGAQPPGAISRFSYRGLDEHGDPLPYDPFATHQALGTSAAILARQVDALHDRTGRPIALIAESEGTLVARSYLDTRPHRAVDDVVLLSPLVRPGRVYFPPPQAGSGWGIATGWELRGMFAVIRVTSSIHSSPDEPFIRSLLDHAPRYRDGMLCLAPGARTIAFLPTAAAAVVPPGQLSEVPIIELPGVHASLLGRPDVQQRIQRFLTGHQAGTAPRPYFAIIQRAASAWQAPALPLALNPAWHATHLPDPAFGANGCALFALPR